MKFNFTIESDNFEEDLDKIVKTFVKAFVKAYADCTEVDHKKSEAHIGDIALAKVQGLDNRIDGIESRLSFCEVETKKKAASTDKK